jgi:hypothetical protein
MYDTGIDDLVQKEIDGTLAQNERAMLDLAVQRDPDVASQRELMKAIARTLDELPRIDTPADFSRAITESLPAATIRTSNLVSIAGSRPRRMAFAAGGVAAAALVAMLFVPYISERIDGDHTGGAMLRPPAPAVIIDLDGNATMRVEETRPRVVFRIDAQPGDRVELEFDATALAPVSVSGADVARQESEVVAVVLRERPATIALERRSQDASAIHLTFTGHDGKKVQRTVNVAASTN